MIEPQNYIKFSGKVICDADSHTKCDAKSWDIIMQSKSIENDNPDLRIASVMMQVLFEKLRIPGIADNLDKIRKGDQLTIEGFMYQDKASDYFIKATRILDIKKAGTWTKSGVRKKRVDTKKRMKTLKKGLRSKK